MYLDKSLQFDPSGTAITATAPSTNVLDMLAKRDMGVGKAFEGHEACLNVGAAFTAVGAATLTVQLQGSVDNAAWTTLVQTDAIPKDNLVAGAKIKVPLPSKEAAPHIAGIPRYYRLNYVVGTGPFTAGTIQADLVPVTQQQEGSGYPSGFAVP